MSGLIPNDDDLTIGDDRSLLRRIHPTEHLVPGKALKKRRLSSSAFSDSSDGSGMSVHIEKTGAKSGRTAESVLQNYPDFYLVRFKAGFARSLGMKLIRDPHDPDHILVVGKKRHRVRVAFRDNVEWVVKPDDLEE
jgi:hypothetical protein